DRLRRLLTAAGEDEDRAWADAWDDPLLAGCPEADPFRPRWQAASQRLTDLAELDRCVQSADQRLGGEDAVVPAADRLPPDYSPRLRARIQQARDRHAALTAVRKALAASPIRDIALADAAERATALGVTPPDVERCRLAVRRRNCLAKIRQIDA